MSKQWSATFNRNVYAPPAMVRIRGPPPTDSYPFMVELRHVTLKSDVFPEVYYQLQAYLYDSQNKHFFGRPWRGAWVKGAGEPEEVRKVVFSETLYFHIPYKDSSNLVVVELVRRRVQALQDEITTLGWNVLRLMPSLPRTDIPQAQLELFRGTPQVMLILQSDPVESDPKLKKSDIRLTYGLRSHPPLRKGYDFIPHNTVVGAEEPVSGLESGDGSDAVLHAPMPKLQSPAVIDHLVLYLGPMAQRIENEVCDFMNKERLLKENHIFDGETMHILEHRIRVGVHNGWTYLHEPYIFHLSSSDLAPDTRSLQRRPAGPRSHTRASSWDMSETAAVGKGRLFLRNRIELNDIIRDPGIGLVFYYQMLVALQGSKPNPPATVVTVAWGVWSPFGEDIDTTSRPVVVTLPLRGGPTRNPDGILCFTDFYSLSEITQRGERPTRPGKSNAITIEFQFNANPRKTEEPPVSTTNGVPTAPPHTIPVSPQPAGSFSPTTSSRQPTPAPPSRSGRAPLQSAIKKPGPVFDPSAMQSLPYPYPQLYWPPFSSNALVPAMSAYPYPASAGHMTEMTVAGPIHAPILALQQQHWRAAGIPRNIMAILDQAKFQPIVDRHGETPELVDVFDATTFGFDADLKDPLLCNEIVFQFMGLARSDFRSQLPQSAFFTFYFYRFPLVTTERLLLSVPEQISVSDSTVPLKILRRVEKTGQLVVGSPGFIVKFIVDPEYLKEGEHGIFLDYLYNHQVCIDVWDGESLMLVGTCVLPLRQLCRRSQEAVQAYCQLPVVTTDNQRPIDHDDGGTVPALQSIMKALLYLRVTCAGYPSAGGIDALLKLNASKATRNAAVITHSLQRDTMGVDLGAVERLVVRPQPLSTRGVVIRPFLVTAKKLQEISDDLPEERRRKLQRLDNIRQVEKYSDAKQNGKLTKEAYIRDIQTLRHLREQTKEKTIMTALFQSLTTVHSIFPTLGSCEFMEYLLNNPFNEPVTVNVDILDNELKLVTDAREWQYFKTVYNLTTPLDANMFTSAMPSRPGDKETTQIFLKPRESLYVPLKYQTFQSIDYPEYKEGHKKPSVRLLLRSKNVKTVFRRADNGDVVSALILQVEPQPHVVHQTFRFYHPENQFLAKYIRIQPQELWETAHKTIEYAYCSDPTVICELRSVGAAGVAQDVFMKVAAGTSPQAKRFCVMLYADLYLSKPVQIWQIYVHAMEKIDVSTVQGNGIKFPIVLKGDQASRLVRCFSSTPHETVLVPNAPFMLNPGATLDVQVLFKPLLAGERTIHISAVDVELREMMKSWLIFASVRSAAMTKAYQVIVHTGTAGRTLNKRVSYTNSYNVRKQFRLASSREDLMTIKEPSVLQLDAGATGVIGLRFNTSVPPQKTEILLFINDEQDKNEDTYGIEAVFLAT